MLWCRGRGRGGGIEGRQNPIKIMAPFLSVLKIVKGVQHSNTFFLLLRYYLEFISRYVYLHSTKKEKKKLYASGGINIAKSIEGGSMKLTTLVDYIYVYVCSHECIFV